MMKQNISLTLALAIIGIVIFVALAVVFGSKALTVQKQIAELESTIETREKTIAATVRRANVKEPTEQEKKEILLQLPVADNEPSYIHELQQVIRTAGVKNSGYTLSRSTEPRQAPPNVNMMTTDLVVEGTLDQIKAYITGIYGMDRITHMSEISLGKTPSNTFSFRGVLTTYYNSNLADPNLLTDLKGN